MYPSPLTTLFLAIPVGVAAAVAVVILDSVVADAFGGALALAALAVVVRSAIRLAGEYPSDDTASQNP
jgi:hypothetical protein